MLTPVDPRVPTLVDDAFDNFGVEKLSEILLNEGKPLGCACGRHGQYQSQVKRNMVLLKLLLYARGINRLLSFLSHPKVQGSPIGRRFGGAVSRPLSGYL